MKLVILLCMKNLIDLYTERQFEGKSLEICFSDMKCNMNCAYCYGDHKNRKFNNSFSLNKDFFLKEFDKIDKSIVSNIHLWGGELTFNGDELKDTVALVRKFFPETPIHVVTNGLLLPKWTDFFIDNNISIGISHDGPGQKYRGYNFLENPDHNESIKRLYDAGLFRKFKTVLHNKNYSTKNIIEFFSQYSDKIDRKVGCDVLLISPNSLSENTFIFKSEEDKQNLYNDTVWATVDIIKNLENNSSYLKRYYQLSDIFKVVRVMDKVFNNVPSNRIAVCDGTSSIAYTSDGKKIPCHCFSEKIVVNKDVKLDLSYVFKKCSKCEFAYTCGGGCAANTNQELDLYCGYSYVKYKAINDTIMSITENNNFKDVQ